MSQLYNDLLDAFEYIANEKDNSELHKAVVSARNATEDLKARGLILDNIDENYFVEAGAGSGKTTALVGRMVKMIEEGKDIKHISAITFTKAAANEFYDRFQKALIEKSLKNDENKEKYLEALQNIDLAFMGTIDSFCNMIMSEHPNEGLIPSNSTVIDDNKAKELYEREYTNIQNGRYNDASLEQKAKLFIKYDDHAKDTFIATIQTILNHRDCELVIPSMNIENIDNKFSDEIGTIRKIVKVLIENPQFIRSSNEDKENELIKALTNNKYIFDNSWDNNTPGITKAFKDTFFSSLNKKTNTSDFRLYFTDEVRELLAEGIDYFKSHDDKWYDIDYDKLSFATKYIEQVKYITTLDFANSAKDKILDVLRKEGNLTFNDYLIYLRNALRKDAETGGKLIGHIYKRHKYYLIDEFQDTDPIQAEIFFYLAAKTVKPNWKDCIPYKGSLFIVGDPKQSIYRFKNADVTSYLKVEEMFNNPEIGQVLHLYKNYRSTVELRNWFNAAFTEILPTTTENQAKYVEIPVDSDDPYCGYFSNVYKYDVPTRAKDEEKDEYKVANILLKIHNNENYKIATKGKDKRGNDIIGVHTIDWKDIMLITPSKPSLANYTKVFREYGIPYYVEGNIVFSESLAFASFVDYFGAVTNPNDNRYLYKILKSEIFKIKESELSQAIINKFEFNILSNIEGLSLSDNLVNALSELKSFATDARKMSSSSLFVKIINNVKAFKTYGNENMEYVYFALELLKAKEQSNEIVSHADAFNFLNGLLSSNNEQERCPSLQANNNQVHLANLHKVKGLEAPVVILAHPNGKDREPNFRMVREDKTNKGYIFDITKSSNKSSFKVISTDMYDGPYKLDEIESANAESLRLEYVAATRARNVLIISNQVTSKGPSEANPWIELLKCSASSKINDIELVLATEKSKKEEKSPIDYDSISTTTNILDNDNLKTLSYELTNPSKTVQNDSTIDMDINSKQEKHINENNGDTLATITGTMVHRLMELIVMSKNNMNKETMVDFVVNENIAPEFVDKKDYFVELLNNVFDTIHNGGFEQKGKAPKDILPVLLSADKVYSEVPFTLKDDNNLWNGIIDLIYEKDNKLHIIDWKTNKNDEGLDEHYKNQLDAYIKATKLSLGKDVEDALIYHIGIK